MFGIRTHFLFPLLAPIVTTGGVGGAGVGGGVGPLGTNFTASIAMSPLYELPLTPTNCIFEICFPAWVLRSIVPTFQEFPWLPFLRNTRLPPTATLREPMELPYMWYLNSSFMGAAGILMGGDSRIAVSPDLRGLEVSVKT